MPTHLPFTFALLQGEHPIRKVEKKKAAFLFHRDIFISLFPGKNKDSQGIGRREDNKESEVAIFSRGMSFCFANAEVLFLLEPNPSCLFRSQVA